MKKNKKKRWRKGEYAKETLRRDLLFECKQAGFVLSKAQERILEGK